MAAKIWPPIVHRCELSPRPLVQRRAARLRTVRESLACVRSRLWSRLPVYVSSPVRSVALAQYRRGSDRTDSTADSRHRLLHHAIPCSGWSWWPEENRMVSSPKRTKNRRRLPEGSEAVDTICPSLSTGHSVRDRNPELHAEVEN